MNLEAGELVGTRSPYSMKQVTQFVIKFVLCLKSQLHYVRSQLVFITLLTVSNVAVKRHTSHGGVSPSCLHILPGPCTMAHVVWALRPYTPYLGSALHVSYLQLSPRMVGCGGGHYSTPRLLQYSVDRTLKLLTVNGCKIPRLYHCTVIHHVSALERCPPHVYP